MREGVGGGCVGLWVCVGGGVVWVGEVWCWGGWKECRGVDVCVCLEGCGVVGWLCGCVGCVCGRDCGVVGRAGMAGLVRDQDIKTLCDAGPRQ